MTATEQRGGEIGVGWWWLVIDDGMAEEQTMNATVYGVNTPENAIEPRSVFVAFYSMCEWIRLYKGCWSWNNQFVAVFPLLIGLQMSTDQLDDILWYTIPCGGIIWPFLKFWYFKDYKPFATYSSSKTSQDWFDYGLMSPYF